MPITLHLGVADVPYGPPPSKGKKKPPKSTGITTGDVAEILEAKYHVMRIFFEMHDEEVINYLGDGLKDALEALFSGAPISLDPFGEGCSKIEDRFKQFLSQREMERLGYPGVPTKAAIKGVNHRFRHPYASANMRRPSFIDTGQYQASFKAWVTT